MSQQPATQRPATLELSGPVIDIVWIPAADLRTDETTTDH
ncbi:hypothetical protein FB461_2194 [Rarobacter faecitabidus]|uniref:Uncharacterized protein n=1 Tax=Rarobacter faecitabidus TaxID=13243 RepID=A0A542ZAT4_RARFA|nr:hypothetical protein FB461_2194 [Rarobacter faecitabidus]